MKEVRERFNLEKKVNEWEKLVKNNELNPEEKFLRIKDAAEEMERKAKEKELLWLIKKRDKMLKDKVQYTVEEEQQINELYFNSIKAKLTLLSNDVDGNEKPGEGYKTKHYKVFPKKK